MKIRNGNINDLTPVKQLAQNTWKQFEEGIDPRKLAEIIHVVCQTKTYTKTYYQNATQFRM
jgi:hypothetical protein